VGHARGELGRRPTGSRRSSWRKLRAAKKTVPTEVGYVTEIHLRASDDGYEIVDE
jgi:hypothetical protein